jgi:hypothetical protein
MRMNMRENIWKVICLLVLLSQYGCKKTPVDPYPRNPREYVWEMTPLASAGVIQSTMNSVWGSSPRDVYAVGHSSIGSVGNMYHFDGSNWTSVGLSLGGIDLADIIGFSPNDIYAVGKRRYQVGTDNVDSALVIHFDGLSWKEILRPHLGVRGLYSIWGSSSTNVYAGSSNGHLLHYDGQSWTVQYLPAGILTEAIGGNEKIVFVVGNSFLNGSSDSTYMFKNSGLGWSLVDKQNFYVHDYSPRFGSTGVYSPGNGIIYSAGPGVFQWTGERWVTKLDSAVGLADIDGSSENNIFAVGVQSVYHWNGTDWALLNVFPNGAPPWTALLGIWTDGQEVFIVGEAEGISYVLHGK